MSYTPINNSELGSSVRSKMNTMFQALFNAVVDPLWTLTGQTIAPVDDRNVAISLLTLMNLNVNDKVYLTDAGEILSTVLGALTVSERDLRVDSNGEFKAKMIGDAPWNLIASDLTLNSTHYSVAALIGVSIINITFPSAQNYLGKTYVITRMGGLRNLRLNRTGADLFFNSQTGQSSSEIIMSEQGQWMILRAVVIAGTYYWFVEAQGMPEKDILVRGITLINDDYAVLQTDLAVLGGSPSKNIEVALFEANAPIDMTFKKAIYGDAGYAFTVVRSGTQTISKDGSHATSITTTVQGAWMRLIFAPETGRWYVIEGGQEWSLIDGTPLPT